MVVPVFGNIGIGSGCTVRVESEIETDPQTICFHFAVTDHLPWPACIAKALQPAAPGEKKGEKKRGSRVFDAVANKSTECRTWNLCSISANARGQMR